MPSSGTLMQRPARLRSPRRPLGATQHDQRSPHTSLAVAAGEEGTDKTRTGMGKRVFVTGASGFLGKHLVHALARSEEAIFYLLCRSALVQLNGDNFLFYNKSLDDLNVEKFTHKHPRRVDGVNDVWHAYPHSSRNLHDIGIARKLDWCLYKRLF